MSMWCIPQMNTMHVLACMHCSPHRTDYAPGCDRVRWIPLVCFAACTTRGSQLITGSRQYLERTQVLSWPAMTHQPHSVYVSSAATTTYSNKNARFPQVTLASGFGGGATSALLLMQPQAVPVNMLVLNHDVIWAVVWWLANYAPYNIPGRVMRWTPIQFVCKVATQVAKGRTICARVSQTLAFYPSATVMAVVVGAQPVDRTPSCASGNG
jgi:TRIC channel